jgi:hypothetical protein
MFISVRVLGVLSVSALSLVTVAPSSSAGPSKRPGQLIIVQAVPKQTLDVAIDGRTVDHGARVGAVLGPFSVGAGSHEVRFTDGGRRLVSAVDVRSGSSRDVVVHLPAQVGGAPVVNTYHTSQKPIASGKARVLLAHTATVSPADVRVDGQVVFRNIANGEYATADVAAGPHTVELVPAGRKGPAILGPLHVDLKAGTITLAYAVGNPRNHSMNVIVHQESLTSNGEVAPTSIDTGRVGLVAGVSVAPFAASRGLVTARDPAAGSAPDWRPRVALLILLATAVALLGLSLRRPPRRRR